MKSKLIYTILAITTLLTGCNSNQILTSKESGKYYTVTIDGEYINYDETDKEIQRIIETIDGFTKASFDVSYKNLDLENEFSYYSKETREFYDEVGMKENTEEWMKLEKLIMKLHEVDIKSIELYNKNTVHAARINLDYISSYPGATDSYLELNDVEIDKKYSRGMNMELVYEDDRWAVKEYILTTRTEVE